MKPPDDITVSQWAERNRILSRKESNLQGYWRNSVTPYLTGIMDEFNNWETEQIIFVKPTQCGGTEGELNMLGYVIDQDPRAGFDRIPERRTGREYEREPHIQYDGDPLPETTLPEKFQQQKGIAV